MKERTAEKQIREITGLRATLHCFITSYQGIKKKVVKKKIIVKDIKIEEYKRALFN